MIPDSVKAWGGDTGVPRVGGGDPTSTISANSDTGCSPRRRG